MTAKKEANAEKQTTEGVANKDTTVVDETKAPKGDVKVDEAGKVVTGDDKTVAAKDGEVTVHVDTTNEADKDPSREIPFAQHTVGTQGVQGIQAGSSDPRVVPTGNAGFDPVLPNIEKSTDQAPEHHDVRDLQPSKVKAAKKEEEKKYPADYELEVDGEVTEELTLQDAADQAYAALVRGSTMPIISKKGKRFVTLTATDHMSQKHVTLRPEDGAISDDEAEVLNKFDTRLLVGAM